MKTVIKNRFYIFFELMKTQKHAKYTVFTTFVKNFLLSAKYYEYYYFTNIVIYYYINEYYYFTNIVIYYYITK